MISRAQAEWFERLSKHSPIYADKQIQKDIVNALHEKAEIVYEPGRNEAAGSCNMLTGQIKIWPTEHAASLAEGLDYKNWRKPTPENPAGESDLEGMFANMCMRELDNSVTHELLHRYSGVSHGEVPTENFDKVRSKIETWIYSQRLKGEEYGFSIDL